MPPGTTPDTRPSRDGAHAGARRALEPSSSGRTTIDERSPYRRRLATLTVLAPDTLRGRIRRELRAIRLATRG